MAERRPPGGSKDRNQSSSSSSSSSNSSSAASPDQPTQSSAVQSGQAATPPVASPVNRMTKYYNRIKRVLKILLAMFCVVTALCLIFFAHGTQYAILTADMHLGDKMACTEDAKMVAVYTVGDSTETLLLSVDSGVHFSNVSTWRRTDFHLEDLSFTPDNKTLLAGGGKQILVVDGSTFSYQTIKFDNMPDGTDSFPMKGVCYIPNTTRAYIYGYSSRILTLDWRNAKLIPQASDSLPGNYLVQTMATDDRGASLKLIAYNNGNLQRTILSGNNIPGLRDLGSRDDQASKDPSGAYSSVPAAFRSYIPRDPFFYSSKIVFDSAGQVWYYSQGDVRYTITSGDKITADRNPGAPGDRLLFSPPYWYRIYSDMIETITPNLPNGIYAPDVLKGAPYIQDVLITRDGPQFAMVGNSSDWRTEHFLYWKQKGNWAINPLLVAKPPPLPPVYEFYGGFLLTLIVIMAGIFLAANYRLRRQIEALIPGIRNDNAFSTKGERPIGLNDPDLLGFDKLEDAILSVIRNPQTQLPFTIVISGNWGSGKSSMMNRIREKLKVDPADRKRFFTTWFNAWHMQDERSLLDAFLLNIVECYERNIPYIFSSFRLKLALNRFYRLSGLKQIGIGFALALFIPFIVVGFVELIPPLHFIKDEYPQIDHYWKGLGNILLFNFKKTELSQFGPFTSLSAIIMALFSAIFLHKQFSSSGLGAFFELLPKKAFNLDVESQETGYREKFKKEYWQIMDSAKNGSRLVVFIDDLDRINGEKVLELLEAINFISDNASRPAGIKLKQPNTIFILGMYAQEVAKNLGIQLNKMNGAEENGKMDPQQAGTRYIEKMVQLIVPVPFKNEQSKLGELYENKT